MGHPELDMGIRRLRAEVEEAPAYRRIRERGDYTLDVLWLRGRFVARFQKTLSASPRGGEAAVRLIHLLREPQDCLVRAVTTYDEFSGRTHREGDLVEARAATVAEAMEKIERMMETYRYSGV
ncbi:MAG: hypothetical protein HY558_06960 [Euryarchaeota archaeon]|nr:hypothetical protein [Euryarchaeota archaeon]